MTMLPPSSDFTGSFVTQGGAKIFISSLRSFISDMLGTDSGDKSAARTALGLGIGSDVQPYNQTLMDISDGSKIVGVTAGSIIDYGGDVVPEGYLACPTAKTYVNATVYSDLAFALRLRWGTGATVAPTAIVAGGVYIITSLGNTNFTTIGASSNAVGVAFVATASGVGTGVVTNQVAIPYFPTGYVAVSGTAGVATVGETIIHSHSGVGIGVGNYGPSDVSGGGSIFVIQGNGGAGETGNTGNGAGNFAAGMGVNKCVKY